MILRIIEKKTDNEFYAINSIPRDLHIPRKNEQCIFEGKKYNIEEIIWDLHNEEVTLMVCEED